jgi:hypothetical protein
MPLSKLRPSFTLTEDRLRELQAVVPEAFADGRINWDTLREARRLAALPSKGTLIPQPGAGAGNKNDTFPRKGGGKAIHEINRQIRPANL